MSVKFKKLKRGQIIAIIVAVVLLAAIIPTAIYCGVNKETPNDLIKDVFTSNQEQLIGNWQSDNGLSAYTFNEDGTYESYISSFSYTATYVSDSSKLTLINPSTSDRVVYKYVIHGDKLTLTLIEENGENPDSEEIYEYKKVENIKTQSILDYLKDHANSQSEESEDE